MRRRPAIGAPALTIQLEHLWIGNSIRRSDSYSKTPLRQLLYDRAASRGCPLYGRLWIRRPELRVRLLGSWTAMRTIRNLVILSLGITLSACAAAEALPSCPAGLPPVTTAPPKLPPRLHNEFTGKAEVSFVISPSGHVQSPAIVSAEWHPVGRSTGQPIGYSEAILSAVASWRYSHRPQACRHRISVEFQAERSSPAA